jgi:hypothetical protein
LRETEEKIRHAEEERKRKESEKLQRKNQKDKLMMKSNMNGCDTGVMDNLLEALQSGELFETNSANRTRRVPRENKRDAANDFRRTMNKKPTFVEAH